MNVTFSTTPPMYQIGDEDVKFSKHQDKIYRALHKRQERQRAMRYITFLLLLIFALFLSGCSDFVDKDQSRHDPASTILLEPGHSAGQTFVARHGGLIGLAIWLEPQPDSKGTLRLYLKSEPQSLENLGFATLSLDEITTPGFYQMILPSSMASHNQYYYAFVEFAGEGAIQIGAASGGSYIDGSAYMDHRPIEAQLTFHLIYTPAGILTDLVQASLKGLALIVIAMLLYIVPGWALLIWLWPDAQHSWAEQLGLAAGISIALYPLLLLWTDLIGIHLGALYAWIPILAGTGGITWRYRRWRPRMVWQALRRWSHSDAFWPDFVLLIILALVFSVRLIVVRTLDVPMWGDSYQHAMIAQLLVDNHGLFNSWEPYAELQTFTYHFGFHTAVAILHWLTKMAVYRATLWVGQIFNGIAILALYPLTMQISHNRWSGTITTLVAGLLLPMPMFYVNWGRYTQLAGQIILPVAMVLSWRLITSSCWNLKTLTLIWIAAGGLALTHYRVLIFYVIFIATLLIAYVDNWRTSLPRLAAGGGGAALLFFPWFSHTFAGRITYYFQQQLTTSPSQLSHFIKQYNAIGNLSRFMHPVAWIAFAIAACVELWQRNREASLISTWTLALLIAANPDWIHLPGTGALSNFAIFIAVYIPAAVLIGNGTGKLIQWISKHLKQTHFIIAGLVIVTGITGAADRAKDVRIISHAMVTRPDLRAMLWIQQHTPRDARFLVNSFFAYGGSVIVGSDAGWWLPLLANRANTVPPLNYSTERGPQPHYREWVNELTAKIQERGVDHPETLDMLRERHVTYVYIGQQQGSVNYHGPSILSPTTLLHSPCYHLLYHQDRVYIFTLHPTSTCERIKG